MLAADERRSPPRCHAGDQSVSQNAWNATEYSPADWRAQRLARRFAVSVHVAALLVALAFTDGRRA
jgi:hypothetical protein